jgi:hypothetical protein
VYPFQYHAPAPVERAAPFTQPLVAADLRLFDLEILLAYGPYDIDGTSARPIPGHLSDCRNVKGIYQPRQ